MYYVNLGKQENEYIPWQGLSLVKERPYASKKTAAPTCLRAEGEPFLDIRPECLVSFSADPGDCRHP